MRALLSRPLGPKQIKDLRDERQKTPVLLAAERGHHHIVRVLAENKFDINSSELRIYDRIIANQHGYDDSVNGL